MDWSHMNYSVMLSMIIGGLVAGFWAQIKMQLRRISGLFVCTVTISSGWASAAVKLYVNSSTEFRRTPSGLRTYVAVGLSIISLRSSRIIPIERFDTGPGTLFWKGWRPLWLGRVGGQGPNGTTASSQSPTELVLRFIRGSFDPDLIMRTAVRLLNERNRGSATNRRFYVRELAGQGGARQRGGEQYGGLKGSSPQASQASNGSGPGGSIDTFELDDVRLGGCRLLEYTPNDIGDPQPPKALEQLSLSADALSVVEEIRHWKTSEQWYRERGIPWRRGYLFHGPPGNVKTQLVRAIACDEDMPVFSFDLGSMSNAELRNAWDSPQGNTPCIVLIEDLDGVFNGRTNILGEQGGGLSFDCFLNVIGGIKECNGIILIITTNHPERLDAAVGVPTGPDGMSSRPGRMDRALQLLPPDEAGRRKMATRICQGYEDLIEALVVAGHKDSGAQFQERCRMAAEKVYWRNKGTREVFGKIIGGVQAPTDAEVQEMSYAPLAAENISDRDYPQRRAGLGNGRPHHPPKITNTK